MGAVISAVEIIDGRCALGTDALSLSLSLSLSKALQDTVTSDFCPYLRYVLLRMVWNVLTVVRPP